MELVEKLDYFRPEKCDEASLYNLKKIGTDIVEAKKKQLEKETELKEKMSLRKSTIFTILTIIF